MCLRFISTWQGPGDLRIPGRSSQYTASTSPEPSRHRQSSSPPARVAAPISSRSYGAAPISTAGSIQEGIHTYSILYRFSSEPVTPSACILYAICWRVVVFCVNRSRCSRAKSSWDFMSPNIVCVSYQHQLAIQYRARKLTCLTIAATTRSMVNMTYALVPNIKRSVSSYVLTSTSFSNNRSAMLRR